MVAAGRSIVCRYGWQTDQLDLAAQRIDNSQHVFQAQGGLACFEVDDEAHADACGQRQLGLCKPEVLASGTQGIAELSR